MDVQKFAKKMMGPKFKRNRALMLENERNGKERESEANRESFFILVLLRHSLGIATSVSVRADLPVSYCRRTSSAILLLLLVVSSIVDYFSPFSSPQE